MSFFTVSQNCNACCPPPCQAPGCPAKQCGSGPPPAVQAKVTQLLGRPPANKQEAKAAINFLRQHGQLPPKGHRHHHCHNHCGIGGGFNGAGLQANPAAFGMNVGFGGAQASAGAFGFGGGNAFASASVIG